MMKPFIVLIVMPILGILIIIVLALPIVLVLLIIGVVADSNASFNIFTGFFGLVLAYLFYFRTKIGKNFFDYITKPFWKLNDYLEE